MRRLYLNTIVAIRVTIIDGNILKYSYKLKNNITLLHHILGYIKLCGFVYVDREII